MTYISSRAYASVAAGETRVGLLFGAVETRKPKAGGSEAPVRGRTSGVYASDDEEKARGKVVVKVAAVLEVGAPFQQHGYVSSWKAGNMVRLARSWPFVVSK